MATIGLNRVIEHLRRTVIRQDGAGLADGDLLERYIDRRDEAAFEALVRRHGPMVLGVCRRILRNEADAEDAFQATFLVLVRKANSIRPRGMVSNWLFGVAQNTALKARSMIHKRSVKEREAGALPKPTAAEELWRQVQALLDVELSRLPDKYRVPIVLCDLEGKTIREAARNLSWPQGTVATRLAQGRKMLAKRLSKHGLALSGGVLATLLSEGAALAGIPTTVLASTIKAATVFSLGQGVPSGLISAKVAALTEGVVKTMFLTKLKIATVTALVAIGLGTGATVLCRTSSATAKPPEASDARTFSDGNTVEGILANPPEQAPATTGDDVNVPRYALKFQIIHKGLERTTDNDRNLKFGLTLPLGVPGKFRISDGEAVLSDAKRDPLGIFLRATVFEEKANSVKIELALDDIGLVDGKADIKRLFGVRLEGPLGEVQECSVDPKAMPRQPTIKVTVQRLNEPQPPRPAIQPARDKNLQSDSSLPTSRSITQPGGNGLPSDAAGFKIEANAQGVKIQTPKFQGTAQRVSYDEAQRLLVLEGSSEFPATIVLQKEQVRAVKIVYSLKEGTLNAESVKLLAR